MNVSQAMETRVSIRAFLDQAIPDDLLHRIFQQTQLAPSNCNTQPCKTYVVSGEKKDALSALLIEEILSGKAANPDFDWSAQYKGVHKERQFGSAAALYSTLGIERDDKKARGEAMLRNWKFFGAPHAVFFTMEKYLNIMGAVDVGVYAQSLALILTENGLGCCMQGALGQYPGPVKELLGLSDSEGVLFGMSIGYPDPDAIVNTTRTERASLETAVHFVS